MHLAKTEEMLDKATERLSSGNKINTAADDAAGMAISTRMVSQVRGLQMAVKNANDGLSMLNSIEGALGEVTNMLQRIRELSVQAVNDSNSGSDRLLIQQEVNQLTSEITRVSTNTRFNAERVLNGDLKSKSFQIGYEGGETVNFTVDNQFNNYWFIWSWLNVLNDSIHSSYDEQKIGTSGPVAQTLGRNPNPKTTDPPKLLEDYQFEIDNLVKSRFIRLRYVNTVQNSACQFIEISFSGYGSFPID